MIAIAVAEAEGIIGLPIALITVVPRAAINTTFSVVLSVMFKFVPS
jgi:hypothetical protein